MARKQACAFIIPQVLVHFSSISVPDFVKCFGTFVDAVVLNPQTEDTLKKIAVQSIGSALRRSSIELFEPVKPVIEKLESSLEGLDKVIFQVNSGQTTSSMTILDDMCSNKRGSYFLLAASTKGRLLNDLIANRKDFTAAHQAWGSYLLGIFSSTNESTQNRVKSLLALIPFLGMEYGRGTSALRMSRQDITIYIDTLAHMVSSDPVPKIVRVSGMVLSKLLLCITVQSDGVFGTTQEREPRDFARLSQETSFVRSTFDRLKICEDKGKLSSISLYHPS